MADKPKILRALPNGLVPPPGLTTEQEQQFIADFYELQRRTAAQAGQPLEDAPPPKPEPKKDVAAAVGLLQLIGQLFTYLNVKAWPVWAKVVVGVPVIAVLSLVYMQKRIDSKGVPLFPDVHPGIVWFDDGSTMGKVQYPSGDSFARDGLAVFHVTWEEYQKLPAVLPAPQVIGGDWQQNVFPVVVWCNTTGFDATAEPMVVRKAHNGALLYQKKPASSMVKLLTPGSTSDSYWVYLADGSKVDMTEATWVKLYMNLKVQEPPTPQPAPVTPPQPTPPKVFAPEKK